MEKEHRTLPNHKNSKKNEYNIILETPLMKPLDSRKVVEDCFEWILLSYDHLEDNQKNFKNTYELLENIIVTFKRDKDYLEKYSSTFS